MTSGRDSTIQVLTRSYVIMFSLDIGKLIPDCLNPRIRSIDAGDDSKTILIGTYSSEIYKLWTKDIKINSNTKYSIKCLLKSHYSPSIKESSEVWGLAVGHDGNFFITVGDDATLRMWSTSQKEILKTMELDIDANSQKLSNDVQTNELQDQAKLRCIDLSPDQVHAAIGCKDGTIRVKSKFNPRLSICMNGVKKK